MTATEPTSKPGQPSTPFDNLYTMNVLGQNHKPEIIVFRFKGSMPDAIERARRHCEIIRRRFISVVPFITDLDASEERFAKLDPM